MQIVQVQPHNEYIYLNLAQAYEAEFSALTHKMPNADGLFSLDTHLNDKTLAFLAYENDVPAGFIVLALEQVRSYEVCEFYIVPSFRLRHLGIKLAFSIWQKYPGAWVVKQIEGADYATTFWRKAISEFTQGRFDEDKYLDPYWGLVTRQVFSIY
ncbi:GNAT family N-acetyltransferase [Paraneptunicella aestuarii]|uniref:GNAT family N-acetyltransferase n=1 Tax=Paraneptunicella aestuarii TaxID=2831148 RepID=UPI001E3D1935|nr:GNAT family N-acetyltransferase [Paraneptunicella aestuarii]UAA38498.1 GNAT family N-acetyltransferase [Paraneptunicella aestuarii]